MLYRFSGCCSRALKCTPSGCALLDSYYVVRYAVCSIELNSPQGNPGGLSTAPYVSQSCAVLGRAVSQPRVEAMPLPSAFFLPETQRRNAMSSTAPCRSPTSFRFTGAQLDKLATLADLVRRPKSDVLRWLIVKATPQDLPPAWLASAEVERTIQADA